MSNAAVSISRDITKEAKKATISTKFSEREIEVIACLIRRMQYKEIASALDISPNTVKNHITSIGKKTGRSSRSGIINYLYSTKSSIILSKEQTKDKFVVLEKSKLNKKMMIAMLFLLVLIIFLLMKTVWI